MEALRNWRMATGGIASAAPCFIRGPWGAVACHGSRCNALGADQDTGKLKWQQWSLWAVL